MRKPDVVSTILDLRSDAPSSTISVADKPLMVFFPGIDGTGMNVIKQFAPLAEKYELRCLNIPNPDRTPFSDLVDICADYLETEIAKSPKDRPIYLLGESFGGVLALAVGLNFPKRVHRLVLVNPATSYPKS
eukprot:4706551-Pyramimonas_sp.AAC.1